MMDGAAVTWPMTDGVLSTGKGMIRTRAEYTDYQLHVEFATPKEVKGNSQERGNSGVFLNGKFEIQVLDSYQNITYPDGQAAAMYGQFPPLVNASRPPGEWQEYDIVFTSPRFGAGGKLEKPAVVTVLHNGVVVHAATAFWDRPRTRRSIYAAMRRGPLPCRTTVIRSATVTSGFVRSRATINDPAKVQSLIARSLNTFEQESVLRETTRACAAHRNKVEVQ
jgi:hypothetical protein